MVSDGFSVQVPQAAGAGMDSVALGGSIIILVGFLSILVLLLRRR